MKNFKNFWKVSFILMVLSVFITQSCNEADQNLTPNLANELSKPAPDGWISSPLNVPDPCLDVCLVAGQHMNVGNVETSIDNEGNLYVTYNIFEPEIYLLEVHLEIFTSIDELENAKKISGGGAIPGKFDYQMHWDEEDMMTSHSVMIPSEDVPQGDCFFIASHAALSNGETAWGGLCEDTDMGVTLDEAKQFPGKNWSVYFQFCKELCDPAVIDFTYAWEDKRNTGNDADYNDLVIQSDVIKTNSEFKIRFLASARGAAYDHSFKFKIPMEGITGIFDSEGPAVYSNDGTFYYITVFNSTKAVLPAEDGFKYANTQTGDLTCLPHPEKMITLTINGDFIYNMDMPYEPFISVYESGDVAVGDSYDLYVYEVSGIDTYLFNGKEYPNGILISDDWKWPYETVKVWIPYEDFTSLTDGWTANWADNLSDPTKVWTCTE